MIDPKELRIGNFFQDRLTGRILIVDSVSTDKVVFDQQGAELPDRWCARPIMLSEEWLRKFGMKQFDHANLRYYLNKEIRFCYSPGNYALSTYKRNPYIEVLEQRIYLDRAPYVHQLQNIYYVFTGEELTLKSVE